MTRSRCTDLLSFDQLAVSLINVPVVLVVVGVAVGGGDQ